MKCNRKLYKRFFIRFLKDSDLYEKWVSHMKIGAWKHMIYRFFAMVHPCMYLMRSFCEFNSWLTRNNDVSGEWIRDMINLDFEWRVICYELDKNNEEYLRNFVNSKYFSRQYIADINLMDKYKFLLNEEPKTNN